MANSKGNVLSFKAPSVTTSPISPAHFYKIVQSIYPLEKLKYTL